MGGGNHCAIPGCKTKRLKGGNIRFFQIPTRPENRQKWLDAISKLTGEPFVPKTQVASVCGIHFDEDDFSNSTVKKMLLAYAVPRNLDGCNINSKPNTTIEKGSRTGTTNVPHIIRINSTGKPFKEVEYNQISNIQNKISHGPLPNFSNIENKVSHVPNFSKRNISQSSLLEDEEVEFGKFPKRQMVLQQSTQDPETAERCGRLSFTVEKKQKLEMGLTMLRMAKDILEDNFVNDDESENFAFTVMFDVQTQVDFSDIAGGSSMLTVNPQNDKAWEHLPKEKAQLMKQFNLLLEDGDKGHTRASRLLEQIKHYKTCKAQNFS